MDDLKTKKMMKWELVEAPPALCFRFSVMKMKNEVKFSQLAGYLTYVR